MTVRDRNAHFDPCLRVGPYQPPPARELVLAAGINVLREDVPFSRYRQCCQRRFAGIRGIAKPTEAFAIPDLDREVKWHAKYARQNGIHVSPTFMIDGLVQPDMGSRDPVADWAARLLND